MKYVSSSSSVSRGYLETTFSKEYFPNSTSLISVENSILILLLFIVDVPHWPRVISGFSPGGGGYSGGKEEKK